VAVLVLVKVDVNKGVLVAVLVEVKVGVRVRVCVNVGVLPEHTGLISAGWLASICPDAALSSFVRSPKSPEPAPFEVHGNIPCQPLFQPFV
jgi:hypothetical protein